MKTEGWSSSGKPTLEGKKMTCGGRRKLRGDNLIKMKLGGDLKVFWQFYSENNGKYHYGKSEI